MKKCRKCGAIKEDDQFYNDKKGKGGLSSRCKDCLYVPKKGRRQSSANNDKGSGYITKLKHLTPIERFESRIVKTESCWLWKGEVSKRYGTFRYHGEKYLAHRFSYEHFIGPIPDGMYVLHTCDVPSCCNPEHLFLGTNADNMADKCSKDRQSRGESHPNAKLDPDKVREIRKLYLDGIGTRRLGDMFGVNSKTIWEIVNGENWKFAE